MDPGEILHLYRNADNITNLYNLKIGVAYVEAKNRLRTSDVLRLCADYRIKSEDPGSCTMGVDQGKGLHVVIGKQDRILHMEIYKNREALDRLMVNFNVKRCVVDVLPETRAAKGSRSGRRRGWFFRGISGEGRWGLKGAFFVRNLYENRIN